MGLLDLKRRRALTPASLPAGHYGGPPALDELTRQKLFKEFDAVGYALPKAA